jgi:hypothetical protein
MIGGYLDAGTTLLSKGADAYGGFTRAGGFYGLFSQGSGPMRANWNGEIPGIGVGGAYG